MRTIQGRLRLSLLILLTAAGAPWARKGSEAAALVVLVDGAYNQDVLLWAGEDFYEYRVMLGRLPKGRHTVAVALNPARSAAGARRAEVKAVRHMSPATPSTPRQREFDFAHAHAPVLYARPNTIDHFTDIPLLMYYEILHE